MTPEGFPSLADTGRQTTTIKLLRSRIDLTRTKSDASVHQATRMPPRARVAIRLPGVVLAPARRRLAKCRTAYSSKFPVKPSDNSVQLRSNPFCRVNPDAVPESLMQLLGSNRLLCPLV